jgi:hypothetical protein
LGFLAARLVERGLERARIDDSERVALVDLLALLEVDRQELAVDLAMNRNRVRRLHGAERTQKNRNVLALRGRHGHWNGDVRGRRRRLCSSVGPP